MTHLEKLVREQAHKVISDGRYHIPYNAYSSCTEATIALQNRLGDFVSYQVTVKATDVPEGCPWEKDALGRPQYVWHTVLAVPKVGIVDPTGAQFNREVLRVMNVPPAHWRLVKSVKGSEPAPS